MKKVKHLLSNRSFQKSTTASDPSTGTLPQAVFELPPGRPPQSKNPPRILVIGAGSRGFTVARAIVHASNGVVAAVADPVASRRKLMGQHHIWGVEEPKEGEEFEGWKHFLEWETARRAREAARDTNPHENEDNEAAEQEQQQEVPKPIDAVVICTLDQTHAEIVTALAPLGLHILCEKPLATTLDDCLRIYRTVKSMQPRRLFGIGHIVRYAPRNERLRKLLLEDEAIGEIVSVVHTEPIGWWHFAHSYVRGNWRTTRTSGASLLTKGCHDIDFLLWMLCYPDPKAGPQPPHLPASVTATGSVVHFKQSQKPAAAGNATNCLSCPLVDECHFSARNIYYEKGLRAGLPGWPVNVVLPDIEDYRSGEGGAEKAKEKLMEALAQDYDATTTPREEIESRSWYGRCVYEADNDVCDDQTVVISWDEDPAAAAPRSETGDGDVPPRKSMRHRGAKTATFHMTAFSNRVRRTLVYGTKGELETDNDKGIITVRSFITGKTEVHKVPLAFGGHAGGDYALARQFVLAVDAVKNHGMSVEDAERVYVGCTAEDIFRSHAMLFAAEEARSRKVTVDWARWCEENAPGVE